MVLNWKTERSVKLSFHNCITVRVPRSRIKENTCFVIIAIFGRICGRGCIFLEGSGSTKFLGGGVGTYLKGEAKCWHKKKTLISDLQRLASISQGSLLGGRLTLYTVGSMLKWLPWVLNFKGQFLGRQRTELTVNQQLCM